MVTLYGTLLRILASVTTCYTLCFIGYFAFNLNQSSLTSKDISIHQDSLLNDHYRFKITSVLFRMFSNNILISSKDLIFISVSI